MSGQIKVRNILTSLLLMVLFEGTESPDNSWPDKLSETGFGLGELACRLNKSTAEGELSTWESGPQQFR